MSGIDRQRVREVLQLAEASVRQHGGGPFAALIVRDGGVLGRGMNRVVPTTDPTAHAEVVALRDACQRAGSVHLEGAVLYASSEPCPMCLAAAYWAHVDRIYYVNPRTAAAQAGFDDARIYDELAKPPERRRLQLVQIPSPDAARPFDAWRAWADKTPY